METTVKEIIHSFLKRRKYVQMWEIETRCRNFGRVRFGVVRLPSTYKRTFNLLINSEGWKDVLKDGRGKIFKHKTWKVN